MVPTRSVLDFLVQEGSLPNVTFPLSRNWAGNIPVNRTNHPNDTLFFWAFEKENGSLTAAAGERSDEPWGIWLNGGYVRHTVPHEYCVLKMLILSRPGSSSLIGQAYEVGGCPHIMSGGCAILLIAPRAEWTCPPECGLEAGTEQLQLGQGCGLRVGLPGFV